MMSQLLTKDLLDKLPTEEEINLYLDIEEDNSEKESNFNRPEFKRMLEDIKNKKIDIILIKDLSRLGRNYIEVGNYVEVVFSTMGVSVISANDNTEINCFDYYKDDNFTFKNLFNDMYAKDISKKVRSSLIVKKIFDMILDGKSRKEIADFLNQNDILTPSEYLNINTNNDAKVKKKWNPEMVNKILRNENYIGALFQGKKRKLNYRVDKKIGL